MLGLANYNVAKENFRSVKAMFEAHGFIIPNNDVLEMLKTDFTESDVFSVNLRARLHNGLTRKEIDGQLFDLYVCLGILTESRTADCYGMTCLKDKASIKQKVIADLDRIQYLAIHYNMQKNPTVDIAEVLEEVQQIEAAIDDSV